jgi:hypothetical protein
MEDEIDGLITRRLLSADARAAMMALLQGKAMVQLASSQGVVREPGYAGNCLGPRSR